MGILIAIDKLTRIVVPIVLVTALHFPASGQMIKSQAFSAGLKGGPLLGWGHYRDKDLKAAYSNRVGLGLTANVFIAFPLKDDFTFNVELGGSTATRTIIFDDGHQENHARYYFADGVALLRRAFNIEVAPRIPGHWFINVGPRVRYWFGGAGTFGSEFDPDFYSYRVAFDEVDQADFTDHKMYMNEVNRWLFGVDVGIGFDVAVKKTQFVTCELRYASGHTYLGKPTSRVTNGTLGFSDDIRTNLKAVGILVGYNFNLDLRDKRKGKGTNNLGGEKKGRRY